MGAQTYIDAILTAFDRVTDDRRQPALQLNPDQRLAVAIAAVAIDKLDDVKIELDLIREWVRSLVNER